MKRLIAVLLSLMMALSAFMVVPFTASAEEADTDETGLTSGTTGDCTWTLDGTELTISGSGAMADYQWDAPWGDKITKAVICDGVTNIGKCAFQHCTELKSISVPDSVTIIDDHALDCCPSLESLTIPEKVTSIGCDAFFGCQSLESITIPASVTSIDATAFSCCSGLKHFSVDKNNPVYDSRNDCNAIIKTAENALIGGFKISTIPDSVVSIGEFAFNICSGLTDITIPDSVTEIGDMAFYSCSNLKTVTVGKGVKVIGKQVFYQCSALDSVILPEGLTEIGVGAFNYCLSLTDITIPDSVTTIRGSAFANCKALTSITIPAGVTTIEVAAFYFCTDLNTVIIPSNVKTIGDQAFGYYYNNGTRQNTDLVIYGFTGTEAQRYANENGFTFAHPSEAPQGSVIPVGEYYLTGSFNGWNHSDERYLFSADHSDDGSEEYKLTVSLKSGEAFKVISAAETWYPDGLDNDCHVSQDGVYDVYFRPNYDGRSDWFNKTIYAVKTSELPPDEPSTELVTEPATEPSTEPATEPATEPFSEPSQTDSYLLGDADGDSKVTIVDATCIQRHLASLPTISYNEKAADADEDGKVTIVDATAIQRHLASLPTNERIGTLI